MWENRWRANYPTLVAGIAIHNSSICATLWQRGKSLSKPAYSCMPWRMMIQIFPNIMIFIYKEKVKNAIQGYPWKAQGEGCGERDGNHTNHQLSMISNNELVFRIYFVLEIALLFQTSHCLQGAADRSLHSQCYIAFWHRRSSKGSEVCFDTDNINLRMFAWPASKIFQSLWSARLSWKPWQKDEGIVVWKSVVWWRKYLDKHKKYLLLVEMCLNKEQYVLTVMFLLPGGEAETSLCSLDLKTTGTIVIIYYGITQHTWFSWINSGFKFTSSL